MRRFIALVIIFVICFSLSACNSNIEPTNITNVPKPMLTEATHSTENTSAGIVYLENPVVLLDNYIVKMVVTGKCDESSTQVKGTIGYIVEIENKSPEVYVKIGLRNLSMDGFMLKEHALLLSTDVIAPGKKSKAIAKFNTEWEPLLEVNTIEDLINLDGSVLLALSDDGTNWHVDSTLYSFDNIIP